MNVRSVTARITSFIFPYIITQCLLAQDTHTSFQKFVVKYIFQTWPLLKFFLSTGMMSDFSRSGWSNDVVSLPYAIAKVYLSTLVKVSLRKKNVHALFNTCIRILQDVKKSTSSATERKILIESKRPWPMRYLFSANEIIYLIQWYGIFYLNKVNVFAWWNLWIAQLKITQ